MGAVLLLVILALLLGGVGLAVEALRWLLIIALVLFAPVSSPVTADAESSSST